MAATTTTTDSTMFVLTYVQALGDRELRPVPVSAKEVLVRYRRGTWTPGRVIAVKPQRRLYLVQWAAAFGKRWPSRWFHMDSLEVVSGDLAS